MHGPNPLPRDAVDLAGPDSRESRSQVAIPKRLASRLAQSVFLSDVRPGDALRPSGYSCEEGSRRQHPRTELPRGAGGALPGSSHHPAPDDAEAWRNARPGRRSAPQPEFSPTRELAFLAQQNSR